MEVSFCKEMIKENLNFTWRSTARYDNLDSEILSLMKKSGCFALYVGAESGSDRILKIVDKQIKTSEVIEKRFFFDFFEISLAFKLL